MLNDTQTIKELIKRFLTVKKESNDLDEQIQKINKRLDEIETEMSDLRNSLYRDRSKAFIQEVSDILDTMIKDGETGEYREAVHELKEIIELWLKDYYHYTRYSTDNLTASKKKT